MAWEDLFKNPGGVVNAPDGTALAPGISFDSDLDSGFYRIGANNIGLSLGGVLKVDFGTTTPVHIKSGSAGAVVANVLHDDLVIENSAESGLSILSPDNLNSSIHFGSPTANSGAFLSWRHAFNNFVVGTNNANATLELRSDVNVTAVHVDASQNVGIGTTAPDGRLHVHTGTAGAVSAGSNADDLVIENSASAGLSILCPDADDGAVQFGTPADSVGADIVWSYDASTPVFHVRTRDSNGELRLSTADTVLAMTIDKSQNIFGKVGTTGMTDGFIFIPAAAGVPSGAVGLTTATLAALYYDTTNDKIMVYDHVANSWLGVAVA